MRFISFIFLASSLAIVSCNNGRNTANTQNTTDTTNHIVRQPVSSKFDKETTQALMSVLSGYYGVKNALVVSKAGKTDTAAMQLATVAGNMQSMLQKDSINEPAIKLYIDTIIAQSKAITAIKDETCEKQRIAFGTLSSAMYGLLKNTELKNAGIYREYCPMAFNEKGAYWLSDDADIKNPYFGKKMLECGEVTDSL